MGWDLLRKPVQISGGDAFAGAAHGGLGRFGLVRLGLVRVGLFWVGWRVLADPAS